MPLKPLMTVLDIETWIKSNLKLARVNRGSSEGEIENAYQDGICCVLDELLTEFFIEKSN